MDWERPDHPESITTLRYGGDIPTVADRYFPIQFVVLHKYEQQMVMGIPRLVIAGGETWMYDL